MDQESAVRRSLLIGIGSLSHIFAAFVTMFREEVIPARFRRPSVMKPDQSHALPRFAGTTP
ncbi:hypothetical protein ACWD4G_19540 [Streptomyces sp. NPDC002643]